MTQSDHPVRDAVAGAVIAANSISGVATQSTPPTTPTEETDHQTEQLTESNQQERDSDQAARMDQADKDAEA